MKLLKTVIILFLLGGMIGCSSESLSETEPVATQISCPPPTPVVIYQQPRSSFLIFVLIENTFPYHESGNIEKAQKDLQVFFETNATSGDKVIMALISEELIKDGLNTGVFFDESVEVIATQVPPTPISTPTELPQPTPIPTRRTQLGATAVALTQVVNDKNFEMTQTAVSNSYNCDYSHVQTQYTVAVSTSDANQTSRNKDFAASVSASFSNAVTEPKEETKKFEGLKIVGDYMKNNCTSAFERCVLLVFSELRDFREEWQSASIDVKVNLEGVDVISVLYDCRYLDGSCKDKVNNWNKHFEHFHARQTMLLLNNNNIAEQLQLSFIQLADESK